MGVVEVDDKFARFGSKSYAINKINSLDIRVAKPYGVGAIWLWSLLALICLLSFLGSLAGTEGPSFGGLIFGAIFSFLAYRAWLSSKIREYQLFLMTSSSEAQAFVSRDQHEVMRLRESIERAMAKA